MAAVTHPAIAAQQRLRVAVEPGFDFDSSAYRALHVAARSSAFQHPDWLAPFYSGLVGSKNADPFVVTARDDGGRLLLVLPLLLRGATIEYAFLGVTDYACAVAVPDLRIDDRLVADLGALLGAAALDIAPVRAADCDLWQSLLGLAPHRLDFGTHAAACDEPYADWRRKVLGGARLGGLERKARNLAAVGPVQLRVAGPDEISAALHAASRFRLGRFTDDPLQDGHGRAFYVDVARRGAASGSARTYLLTCNGDLVAVLFGLVDGDCFRYLLLACDYVRFGRYSPGMIAFDRTMADWFGGGGRVFDFTIGDEPFKAGFGARPTPMYRFARP